MHTPDSEPGAPETEANRATKAASHDFTEALAEIELGAFGTSQAFQRWIVRCMAIAGLKDLTVVDVLVLHHVNHRASDKRLADISFVLNIEDSHVVGYSLRKLAGLGVIRADRHGKEVTYAITPSGQAFLRRYTEIREQRLIDALITIGLNNSVLGELAQYLRRMSGLYDQAARAATSI